MQVNVEELNSTRRKLAVEVPVEDVKAELDRAFGRLQRQATLKGFRPGRAPRSVVEKLFGDQVRADVLSHLIEHSYSDAVKQAGLQPVGAPEIVPESIEAGKPLRYSATVDVLPPIEIREREGLPAKRPRRAIGEEDVDRAVVQLRESLAELRPVEGRDEAREGDFVSIDYDVSVDGKPLPGAKRENRLFELGAGNGPAEIDRALAGAKVGEHRTADVDFPEDHGDRALAGKRARFDLTLRGIREKILPPADDELAKEHGECTTLEELRAKLRERLAESYRREADDQVRGQIVDELVKRNPFDVPQSLVERQVASFVEDLTSRLGERRAELERDAERLEKLRADYRPRAEQQVRAVLALDAVARDMGIAIADADVDRRIGEMAANAGEQGARLREIYREDGARAELRARLARERALDAIVSAARVEDVEVPANVVAPKQENGYSPITGKSGAEG
jgi:trigger factor